MSAWLFHDYAISSLGLSQSMFVVTNNLTAGRALQTVILTAPFSPFWWIVPQIPPDWPISSHPCPRPSWPLPIPGSGKPWQGFGVFGGEAVSGARKNWARPGGRDDGAMVDRMDWLHFIAKAKPGSQSSPPPYVGHLELGGVFRDKFFI